MLPSPPIPSTRLFLTAAILVAGLVIAPAWGEAADPPPPPKKGETEKPPGKPEKTAPPKEMKKGDEEKIPPGKEDPALTKTLLRLDKTNATLKTVVASYLQLRKVRISKRIRKAKGVFRLEKRPKPKGMRILFEETEPHRMRLLFTDTRVVFHDVDADKIDIRDPRKGGVRPSEIWVLGRPLAELRKSYSFTLLPLAEKEKAAWTACLKLVPRSKKIRRWVREMRIWLRKKDSLPMRVKLIDPSGEYQEFIFEDKTMKINQKIDPQVFRVGE